jgi:thiamine transporter ThiT
MKIFLKHALDPVCVKRAIKTSLVVGTVLGLINHSDKLIHGTLTRTSIIQIVVTYLVPYSVATFGAAMQARHMEIEKLRTESERARIAQR